jgi:hypothetical protein
VMRQIRHALTARSVSPPVPTQRTDR